MKPVKEIKKIQVKGEKHLVTIEAAEMETLIKKGLALKRKLDKDKKELEKVQIRLVEIAEKRRKGTTVTLSGISGEALVTFRETFKVDVNIGDLQQPLGPLFEKFFTKKEEYKTTADFKKFVEGEHTQGIAEPEKVRKEIMKYVAIKTTKPNVKLEEKAHD